MDIIYENHICELWDEEWYKSRSSIEATFAVANREPEKNIFPYKPEFFFFLRLSFRNCISCVYSCDYLLSYNIIVLF